MTLLTTEWLQTKSYAAIKDRYAFSHLKSGIYEGPLNEADYVVSQRAAGANMSVDVSAGSAFVQGDDTARQGMYHIVNDAVVNVAVSAAHATLPRVDIIYLRANDSSVPSGSGDDPTLVVAAGTATSSAQSTDPEAANYRLGAPSLPNGCLHLADIQVDAAVTSIVTAKIWDKRARRRGVSNIATEESRTNTAYGLMTTPDRIRNLVVPTDGLIALRYKATWKESVLAAARAAIFIGANQMKVPVTSASGGINTSAVQAAAIPQPTGATADRYSVMSAVPFGLVSLGHYDGVSFVNYGGDVTTGQALAIINKQTTENRGIWMESPPAGAGDVVSGFFNGLGGACLIWLAAGTYDLSVRFKASSGSVSAKDRKLYAEVWDPDQVSF